jgi:hypothetical protein
LAGSVRIAGPEFSDARSRAAFARIEESIRQFTSHSRENISLVRNPFRISHDHFVLLWSRGAAVSALVHQGGRVHGDMHDAWSSESAKKAKSQEFENPLPQLSIARSELVTMLQSVVKVKPVRSGGVVEAVTDADVEDDPVAELERERLGRPAPLDPIKGIEFSTRGLAILTEPIERLRIEQLDESKELAAIALEQAVARTIFHMPNLLRIVDFETTFFSNDDLARGTDALEQQADAQSAKREAYPAPKPTAKRRESGRKPVWLYALLGLVAIGALVYLMFGSNEPDPVQKPPIDTTQVIDPKPNTGAISEIVLTLPQETQAFISPVQYKTRAELLRAIGGGEGIRMLPQKSQLIKYDSIQFAKGVYGYFKVEGTWRTGKLLQTLKPRDSVIIENFLPPLP